MVALIVLAAGIGLGDPTNWTWAALGGSYVVNTLDFLAQTKPFSVLILLAVALAIFMTRLKY